MQFVERVGRALSSVSEFYRDINPSTLTGAIDVIVVEDSFGKLSCSPFHVRFGKLKLFRPQDKVVDIHVNGNPVDVKMKVGEAGEAFFVIETQEPVPLGLATSPLAKPIESPLLLDSDIEKYKLIPSSTNLMNDSINYPLSDSEIEIGPNKKLSDKSSFNIDNQIFPKDEPLSDTELDMVNDSLNHHHHHQLSSNNDKLAINGSEKEEEDTWTWKWGSLPVKSEDHNHDNDQPKLPVYKDISFNTILKNQVYFNLICKKLFHLDPNNFIKTNSMKVSKCGEKLLHLDNTLSANVTSVATIENTELFMELLEEFFSKDLLPSDSLELTTLLNEKNQYICQIEKGTTPWTSEDQMIKWFENMGMNQTNQLFIVDHTQDGPGLAGTLSSSSISTTSDSQSRSDASTRSDASFNSSSTSVSSGGWRSWWSSKNKKLESSAATATVSNGNESLITTTASKRFDEKKNSDKLATAARTPSTSSSSEEKLFSHKGSSHPSSAPGSPPSNPPSSSIPIPGSKNSESASKSLSKNYLKSLRLTSEQLSSLSLKPGLNSVVFTVSGGRGSCSSRVYRWKWDDKIVISDVDGTITKSDVFGHLFPMMGKDWTHSGVAQLFSKILLNGYQLLYLTSRALGQAESTRSYLKSIEQERGQFSLPDGPVIMSPDRLFTALHREMIARRPEEFKIACLKDIQSLFSYKHSEDHSFTQPFYAGFGNRPTDIVSYRGVNIPDHRIFIINSKGQISTPPTLPLPLLPSNPSSTTSLVNMSSQSSSPLSSSASVSSSSAKIPVRTGKPFIVGGRNYLKLTDWVDLIFPPCRMADDEWSDLHFWKKADDFYLPPPVSPLPSVSSASSSSSLSSSPTSLLKKQSDVSNIMNDAFSDRSFISESGSLFESSGPILDNHPEEPKMTESQNADEEDEGSEMEENVGEGQGEMRQSLSMNSVIINEALLSLLMNHPQASSEIASLNRRTSQRLKVIKNEPEPEAEFEETGEETVLSDLIDDLEEKEGEDHGMEEATETDEEDEVEYHPYI